MDRNKVIFFVITRRINFLNIIFSVFGTTLSMLGGVPVPTAYHVLGLRIEEAPPAMEGSCKYIE
jgi:hypothetical protein